LTPDSAELLPAGPYSFEIRVETDVRHVYRGLQRLMSDYKNEKRGPTFVAVHSCQGRQNVFARVMLSGLRICLIAVTRLSIYFCVIWIVSKFSVAFVCTVADLQWLVASMPAIADFPLVPMHISEE